MMKQANVIVKSCNYKLRVMDIIRKYLTVEASSSLSCAHISRMLDYGNSLMAGLTDTEIQTLQHIQNIRILTRTKKYKHISHVFRDCMTKNELVPACISAFELYEPCCTLRSRNQLNLNVHKTHPKSYCNKAFCQAAPVSWNNPPLEIKPCYFS